MSVVLSCLYEVGLQLLKWKLAIFICRSLYDELQTEEKCVYPMKRTRHLYDCSMKQKRMKIAPDSLFSRCGWTKTIPKERFDIITGCFKDFPYSFPWIVSLYWKKLLLVWSRRYKKEVHSRVCHPSRDANRYPLRGVDVCR